MPIETAMTLIYNLIHEQSESLTSDQLEALNLGLSALKTIGDFKLNFSQLAPDYVSRETILGRKLLEVTKFKCDGIRCVDCQYFDNAYGCTSQFAGRLVYHLEKENTIIEDMKLKSASLYGSNVSRETLDKVEKETT